MERGRFKGDLLRRRPSTRAHAAFRLTGPPDFPPAY